MKPYYQDNAVTIYHGDCREIVPTLGKFDLCLTSPPYNLGNVHHNKNTRHSPYPDEIPEEKYQEMQVETLNILHDSCESVYYNHKNRIREGREISPRDWIAKTMWWIRQELVWINGGPNHDPIRFFPKTERVWWLVKPTTRNADNRELTDVLEFSPDAGKLGQGHNRTFPLQLATALIGVLPWADTILDPFAGSCTTGRAAKDLRRKCVCIEMEERYCDIGAKRIQQEVLAL